MEVHPDHAIACSHLFAMEGPRKMCGGLPLICHGGTSPAAVDCTQLFAMGRDLAEAVRRPVICHGGTSRVAVSDQLFAMVGPRR